MGGMKAMLMDQEEANAHYGDENEAHLYELYGEEESMIIMVIGNIASGKSTICRALLKELPGFKHLELDVYRHKYNKKRTLDGDNKAQRALLDDIKSNDKVIVECSGTGKWYSQYFRLDVHDTHHIILLDSTVKLCKSRHTRRIKEGYKLPPIPSTWSLSIDKSLQFMHSKLRFAGEDLSLKATGGVDANVKRIIKYLSEGNDD